VSALIRMIRAGRDQGRILESSLDDLAQVFGDPETAAQVGGEFTCAEADCIARVLIASRHADAAAVWLAAHATGDTTEDRHGGAGFDTDEYIWGR
jgi:hypothetical protein